MTGINKNCSLSIRDGKILFFSNKKNELINHPSEFEYYDLDTENWRNIIKLYFEKFYLKYKL